MDGQPPREAAARRIRLFSKAGSNVVESAAILMEFVAAPHERWVELAKRMHDTEHALGREVFPTLFERNVGLTAEVDAYRVGEDPRVAAVSAATAR